MSWREIAKERERRRKEHEAFQEKRVLDTVLHWLSKAPNAGMVCQVPIQPYLDTDCLSVVEGSMCPDGPQIEVRRFDLRKWSIEGVHYWAAVEVGKEDKPYRVGPRCQMQPVRMR